MRETAKQSAIAGSSIAGGVAFGAASVAAVPDIGINPNIVYNAICLLTRSYLGDLPAFGLVFFGLKLRFHVP